MEDNDKAQKGNKRKIIIGILVLILLIAVGIYIYIGFVLNKITTPEVSEKIPERLDKVNVLVLGVADGLSDTLLLCSYNPKTDDIKMVSIPRDTYYPRPGYKHTAQKKINSAFGSEGAEGAVKSVEGLTGVPVNYYIKIDYKAVEQIVDALGGIQVTVSHNMNYDDPADDLHIHFEKGAVVESGSDIVKVLRWRKNNQGKGGYPEGDLGRIKTQHEIIKTGIEKILSGNIAINLIKLQNPIIDNVKTNMPPERMAYYLSKIKNIKEEKIDIQTLPGEAKDIDGLSFFVGDEIKMRELFNSMKNEEISN